jgi:hypothetical protein
MQGHEHNFERAIECYFYDLWVSNKYFWILGFDFFFHPIIIFIFNMHILGIQFQYFILYYF